MEKKWILIAVIGVFAIYVIIRLIAYSFVAKHCVKVLACGGKITAGQIIGMYLRGNPPSLIVDAYVVLIHSNIQITINELESLYIANKTLVHDVPSLIELAKKQKSA